MFGFIDLLSCVILVVFFVVVLQYFTGFSFGRYLNKFTHRMSTGGGNDHYGWYNDYVPSNYTSEDMFERYQTLCHQLAMARRRIEVLQTEIQDLDDENQQLYNANIRLKKQYKRNRDRVKKYKADTLTKAGLRSVGTLSPDDALSPAESSGKLIVPLASAEA